jgi:chemotaxis protein methyltransferase WspC
MAKSEIENLLRQAMGLDAASIGSTSVDRAVRLRMAACALERVEDYWSKLRADGGELQELIEALVVPETWFFREAAAFAALAHAVETAVLPANETGVLTLLSVPCSTGEEPYSIAMALLDAGLPPHRFAVDAVDISARALAKAGRAVYGSNSFRGGDLNFRERYFRPSPEGYHLADAVRERVRFRQANLLEPGFQAGRDRYEVIFCRNLLIYFDRPTQERAVKTLERLLAPSGLLFVSPAEAFLMTNSGFSSAGYARAFSYRKTPPGQRESGETPAKAVRARAPLPPRPAAKRPAAPRARVASVGVVAVASTTLAAPPAGLEIAVQLADAGRLVEAAQACEAHLRDRASADGYCLLGLVRDALNDAHRAGECYRKALYLDPNHIEALAHLALSSERRGDTAAAQRLRDRARRAGEHAPGTGDLTNVHRRTTDT